MKHQPDRWRTDYERDGYLVVDDCVDAQTIARLRSGIEKIQNGLDQLPPHLRAQVHLEKDFAKVQPEQAAGIAEQQMGQAIKLIMELPLFAPMFAELICYAPLLDVLEVLFGSGEFAFHNYKAIIKAPRVSSAFIWHRDLPYLEHSTPNLITAMLCLDEMTEANGATVVYPGTHRIAHELVTKADVAIPEAKLPKEIQPVTVTCPAGSAVLFHVNLIHGGGANRSNIPRRNVIGIWSGPDTYPVTGARYVHQDLMPRSANPARQRQTRMTFPSLFGETPLKPIAHFHAGAIEDKESELKTVKAR